MALEKLNRKADVTEESRKYYRLRHALRKWRAAGMPPFEGGLMREPGNAPHWFIAGALRLKSPGDLKPVTMRVRCTGTLHKVTVHPCGRITFHSHTKQGLAAERTLLSLGGEPCGCLATIKRVLESPAWRGENAVIDKTTQHWKNMRGSVQYNLRPGAVVPERSKQARTRDIDSRVANAASRWLRGPVWATDIHKDNIHVGIADAEHPPGVFISAPQRWSTYEGWKEKRASEMLVVLPREWVLRLHDRPSTGFIDGFIVFDAMLTSKVHGWAKVAVRTGPTTVEMQQHEFRRVAGGPWRFVQQPTVYNPR